MYVKLVAGIVAVSMLLPIKIPLRNLIFVVVVAIQLLFTWIAAHSHIWHDARLNDPNIENEEQNKIPFRTNSFDTSTQYNKGSWADQKDCMYTYGVLPKDNFQKCFHGYIGDDDYRKVAWYTPSSLWNGHIMQQFAHLQVFNYYYAQFLFTIILDCLIFFLSGPKLKLIDYNKEDKN
jgi:hypothetical protein